MKLYFRPKINATVTSNPLTVSPSALKYDDTIADYYYSNEALTLTITGIPNNVCYFTDYPNTQKSYTKLSSNLFHFNTTTYYKDNGTTPNGNQIICSGKYYFECGTSGPNSSPFHYLTNELSLDPPPTTTNNKRTYSPSSIVTITSSIPITGPIYFTDYPNTKTKYIAINPVNGSYTLNFSTVNAQNFSSGLYYFEHLNGYSSLPFIYNIATTDGPIWPPENPFPLSGFAITLAETGKPLNDAPTFDYPSIYKGTAGYAKIDLSKTTTNFLRIPFSYCNNGTSGNVYGLFNNSDYDNLTVNTQYANAFIPYVKSFVLSNPSIVIMLDAHNYGQWTSGTNVTPANIAKIWCRIVNVFKNDYQFDLNQYMNVFFEIENEPYSCEDYAAYYQPVIDALRAIPCNNKIVMGGNQGSIGKFVQYNFTSTYPNPNTGNNVGLVNYTGKFPQGTNLAITLHNYFDLNGSGTLYKQEMTLAQTKQVMTASTISTCMFKLGTPKIDLIYGEFGFPSITDTVNSDSTNYNNNLQSYDYVLNLMKDYVTAHPPVKQGQAIDLTKSNGDFLGFCSWSFPGTLYNYDPHNIDQTLMSDFYIAKGYISNKS